MIGAIAGDMIGCPYEFNNVSNEDFGALFESKSTYTDDTVLTVATADVILDGSKYSEQYLSYAQCYANRGYGGNFAEMVKRGRLEPYDSYGNGSAMRVSPVGWAYDTFSDTVSEAKRSAECTHNHEEGVRGAKAVAVAIFSARNGGSKDDVKSMVEDCGYDLSQKTYDFRQGKFDVSCQGTIPRCMAIILETNDFESAIRKAVAMGGDTDTNCCIVGSICDAIYGLPEQDIIDEVYARLPKQMTDIVTAFTKKYIDTDFEEPKNVATKASTFGDSLGSLFSM